MTYVIRESAGKRRWLITSNVIDWTEAATRLTTAHICLHHLEYQLVLLLIHQLTVVAITKDVVPSEKAVRGLTTSIQAILQAIIYPPRIPLIDTESEPEPESLEIHHLCILEVETCLPKCL